jgi:transcriptional regulator with XRE-family HTH domain
LTGAELKRVRLQLGLTQQALAMRLGVQRNSVWRWETGYVRISRLVALAMKGLVVEEGGRKGR